MLSSKLGGPTRSQLSRPVSSGHHISMEHRLRRKHLQLNSDANAGSEFLEENNRKGNRHFYNKIFSTMFSGFGVCSDD